MPEALRDVYGESLRRYGLANDRVVVLDADLATSTKSVLFGKACPDRFFDVGIAEANMVSMAAGFAACGYIPFVNTFATFIASIGAVSAKCLIGYSHLNVRLMGGNNGLTGGYDGATHHCLDDINVMRGIPGMLVTSPCDPVQMDWLVQTLIDDYRGPAYVSISRMGAGPVYKAGERFTLGKAKRVCAGADATVFACGLSVPRALEAVDRLRQEGLSIALWDMFTLKPLDEEAVRDAARETGAIVAVEEHSVLGGLGTAVAEVLAESGLAVPFRRVGIRDRYTESGSYPQLVEAFGLGVDAIADAVRQTVARKKGARG
ncbi:MAG: hypothetical protein GX418_15185 [Clostridiales bacterium]|nr:hypothetical protein [Clostridiales bacterium]